MACEKSCEWCEHCLYVGEGDFWCDERHEIIASEFEIHEIEACDMYREVSS